MAQGRGKRGAAGRSRRAVLGGIVAGALLLTGAGSARGEAQPLPPGQPPSGPAGSDYTAPGEPFVDGVDGLGGYIVQEPNPRPVSAPVVLVLRGGCVGHCSMDKKSSALFDLRTHLVKKGNIVVFPHYQEADEPELEQQRVVSALNAALAYLSEGEHTRPDLSSFGIVGHSRGSQMAVLVAARQIEFAIPTPKWLIVAQPGPTSTIDFGSLAAIPSATRVVMVVGEDDVNAGETKAKDIWASIGQIPLENRDYVRVRSDRRGIYAPARDAQSPACAAVTEADWWGGKLVACATTNQVATFTPRSGRVAGLGVPRNPAAATGDLTADHFFPGSGGPLEVHVLWKFAQALVECTSGAPLVAPSTPAPAACAYALGNTPQQRDMGVWSDGVPVNEVCVTDDPEEAWTESCPPGRTW